MVHQCPKALKFSGAVPAPEIQAIKIVQKIAWVQFLHPRYFRFRIGCNSDSATRRNLQENINMIGNRLTNQLVIKEFRVQNLHPKLLNLIW